MSKRNQTVNRLYQLAAPLQLNAIRSRFVRRLIEQAYDAGRAHATAEVRAVLDEISDEYRDKPYARLGAIERTVRRG